MSWKASGGTVSSTGLYTAPSTTGTFTVTATSMADSTKSASATATVTTATSDTLPTGLGWHELSNTSLSSLCPSNLPYFSSIQGDGCNGVIEAWSSGFYDKNRRQLVIWGGGHVDYGGNEFYAIQLDGNPAFAKRLNDPSSCTGCQVGGANQTGNVNDDGSPRSTHTYDALMYDPVDDVIIVPGLHSTYSASSGDGNVWTLAKSALPGSGTSTGANHTAAPPWSVANTNYLNGTTGGPGAGTGDFDPNTNLIYYTAANLGPGLYAFNPSGSATRAGVAPHAVVTINGANAGCYDCTAAVDPVEKRLYQFGDYVSGGAAGSPFQYWNIDPLSGNYGAVTRLGTPSGCPSFPGGGPGADWDPVAQMFVVWPSSGNPSTSQLYAYNPSSSSKSYGSISVPANSCVGLNPAGSAPPSAATNDGTFKRFRYVNYCDCFVVMNDWGQNAFIVRTR